MKRQVIFFFILICSSFYYQNIYCQNIYNDTIMYSNNQSTRDVHLELFFSINGFFMYDSLPGDVTFYLGMYDPVYNCKFLYVAPGKAIIYDVPLAIIDSAHRISMRLYTSLFVDPHPVDENFRQVLDQSSSHILYVNKPEPGSFYFGKYRSLQRKHFSFYFKYPIVPNIRTVWQSKRIVYTKREIGMVTIIGHRALVIPIGGGLSGIARMMYFSPDTLSKALLRASYTKLFRYRVRLFKPAVKLYDYRIYNGW